MDLDEGDRNLNDAHDDPMAYATGYHAPVLCKNVVAGLVVNRQGTYVDGTLGGGGHTAALLDVIGSSGRVVGIDRDGDAVDEARRRLDGEVARGRLILIRGNFGEMNALLEAIHVSEVDGILLDLGISSHQVDVAVRGFSYASTGRLDMRMDDAGPITAADVVNDWSEQDIRSTLFEFGEEPRARAIARAIVQARPLETTADLARVVRASVPQREEVKSLSRVFQAVRIAVNQELDALDRALQDAVHLIRLEGRMIVISYHSLEDRRVKRFFRYGNLAGEPMRDFYGNLLTPWKELTRRPVRPADEEIKANPRARSARLRIAERIKVEGKDT